jgi:hypothetical protein
VTSQFYLWLARLGAHALTIYQYEGYGAAAALDLAEYLAQVEGDGMHAEEHLVRDL